MEYGKQWPPFAGLPERRAMAETMTMPTNQTGSWATEANAQRSHGPCVSSRALARVLRATGAARHDGGQPLAFGLHLLGEGRFRAEVRPPRAGALSEDIYADEDGGAVLHARQCEDRLVAVAHGEWNEAACLNLGDCLVRALDAGCLVFVLDLGCPDTLTPGVRAVIESLSRCLTREGHAADIRLCRLDAV